MTCLHSGLGGYGCSPETLPSPVVREPDWWGLASPGRVEVGRYLWLRKGPSLPLVAASPLSRPHLEAGLAMGMLKGQV